MKTLIFGQSGQLGASLCEQISTDYVAADLDQVDFSKPESVRKFINDVKPELILNAAAYTNVEGAETDYETALTVNAESVGMLAEYSKKNNALLIHYSTDYVFDGKKGGTYSETDSVAPLNAYGKSKLAGETKIQKHGPRALILRTSSVYSRRSKNFLLTMLRMAAEKKEFLNVVQDQVSVPTWADWIAEATLKLVQNSSFIASVKSPIILNAVASGEASWAEFAEKIFEISKAPVKVNRIRALEYPSMVNRPAYSVLSNQKLRGIIGSIPEWDEMLLSCLKS